jgi:hypothetical protein
MTTLLLSILVACVAVRIKRRQRRARRQLDLFRDWQQHVQETQLCGDWGPDPEPPAHPQSPPAPPAPPVEPEPPHPHGPGKTPLPGRALIHGRVAVQFYPCLLPVWTGRGWRRYPRHREMLCVYEAEWKVPMN